MAARSTLVARPEGVLVRVHVQPGAARPRIAGVHGDALKIAVREKAEQGRATRAVLEALAVALSLRAAQVTLASGARSRGKWVLVSGLTLAEVEARLGRLLGEGGRGG